MIKKILLVLLSPCLVGAQSAFISGNDTICDNGYMDAQVKVSFSGATPPFTFVYAINGINQPSILTTINPSIINTKLEGSYTLTSFADVLTVGSISGSALVTIHQAPMSIFTTVTDTLSILYPSVQLNDLSIGNITDWNWNFGDNTANDISQSPYHIYKDSIAIYQLSLIVIDDFGCSDTAFKQIWISDEYWIYIPNSFTPDLDGVNDLFCIESHGIRENTFLFKVYNAQGDLMYQSTTPNELRCSINGGWNGKYYKTQKDLPSDTYAYEIYFQDFEGWKHTEYGTIVLVR